MAYQRSTTNEGNPKRRRTNEPTRNSLANPIPKLPGIAHMLRTAGSFDASLHFSNARAGDFQQNGIPEPTAYPTTNSDQLPGFRTLFPKFQRSRPSESLQQYTISARGSKFTSQLTRTVPSPLEQNDQPIFNSRIPSSNQAGKRSVTTDRPDTISVPIYTPSSNDAGAKHWFLRPLIIRPEPAVLTSQGRAVVGQPSLATATRDEIFGAFPAKPDLPADRTNVEGRNVKVAHAEFQSASGAEIAEYISYISVRKDQSDSFGSHRRP